MSTWIALGLMIIAGVLLVLRHDAGTIGGYDPSDFAAIVAGVALLIFLGAPLINEYRGRATSMARDLMMWGLIGLALIGIYAFRAELGMIANRITGELTPAGTATVVTEQGEAAVRIRKRSGGHFIAYTEINGNSISMIVDTGATTVLLRPSDAERIGISIDGLRYTVPIKTANGMTFAAPVRLEKVSIGPIAVERVEALVAKPGTLEESLLGMSFLSRLRSYGVSGDYLTLRG